MTELLELCESTIHIKRNKFLKLAGQIDTNVYYVESGSLKIFVQNEQEEQIIRFGYTSDLIVSLDSFITERPSDFYIQAIKKTVLKVIPKKRVVQFIDRNENNKIFWIRLLENLILQQMEREKDLLITSSKERINRVLKRSPRLFQEIPNRHIANYLGMSAETLSRLRKS